MNIKWKYNGKIYNSRKEIMKTFGWSTCKWNAKVKDNKIIKLIIEDNSYEDLHKNTK